MSVLVRRRDRAAWGAVPEPVIQKVAARAGRTKRGGCGAVCIGTRPACRVGGGCRSRLSAATTPDTFRCRAERAGPAALFARRLPRTAQPLFSTSVPVSPQECCPCLLP